MYIAQAMVITTTKGKYEFDHDDLVLVVTGEHKEFPDHSACGCSGYANTSDVLVKDVRIGAMVIPSQICKKGWSTPVGFPRKIMQWIPHPYAEEVTAID